MDDQLKTLFDYTKFHIGMYTTLIAAIVGVFSIEAVKLIYPEMFVYIKITIALFFIASMAGGLIASSIPFFTSFKDFEQARLGPWSLKLIPSVLCIHIEHTAFWCGSFVACIGLWHAHP